MSTSYLSKYPQTEIDALLKSGSISSSFDSNFNLYIESTASINSSMITIPLKVTEFDSVKVESKYDTKFTEL